MPLVDKLERPIEEGCVVVWSPSNKIKDGQIIKIVEPLLTAENQKPVRKLIIMAVYEYIIPPGVQQMSDLYILGKQELPEFLQERSGLEVKR